jgi:hypothetical protein
MFFFCILDVHKAIQTNQARGEGEPALPPYPDMSALRLDGDYDAPPRPPPPGMSAHKWWIQYGKP